VERSDPACDAFSLVGAFVRFICGLLVAVALLNWAQFYELRSNTALTNSTVAIAHALVDGRANVDGYKSFGPGSRTIPDPAPVLVENAEAAVAANQATAAYYTDLSTEARDTLRWIYGVRLQSS